MNHNFQLVGGDTDGLAFKKPDQSDFPPEERKVLLTELNSLMDGLVKWDDDGVFPFQLVVKTKNYVLINSKGVVIIKGSALKASMKEKKLKQFILDIIKMFIENKESEINSVYMNYAKEILHLKDMTQWCSKYTITKAVLTGKGTSQVRIREALKGRPVQEGDKVYQFFKSETERCMLEDFDGTFCEATLLDKLYSTLKIFETVIDVKKIPNLNLKRNKKILDDLKRDNEKVFKL